MASIDDIMNPRRMQASAILARIIHAVYETIAAAGQDGAPAGQIYAALMTQGCTLEQYQQLESMMIRSGLVEKRGDRLFAAAPRGGR